MTISVYTSVLYQVPCPMSYTGTSHLGGVQRVSRPSVPDGGAAGAAVEPEVHVTVHQVDGDEVAAPRVVAVQQRPVGQRGSKGHLELGEGQVALEGLRPGDGCVRPQRLVEEGQQQRESFGGRQKEKR